MSCVIPSFNGGRRLLYGHWRRLVNGYTIKTTKTSHSMHAQCTDTVTNHIVFIKHIIAPIHNDR